MVWIDIVCCVIIAIFALLGLWHGLLKSIFKLIAWVAGLLGAYFATDVIGNFIATNLEIDGLTVKIICVCVGFLVPFRARRCKSPNTLFPVPDHHPPDSRLGRTQGRPQQRPFVQCLPVESRDHGNLL